MEYTFGYTRCDDGKVRIFLHHSSVPYSAAPRLPAAQQIPAADAAKFNPPTETEVLATHERMLIRFICS